MEKIQNAFQRFKERFSRKSQPQTDHPSCQFTTEKKWLDRQHHKDGRIKKPDEVENEIEDPPGSLDEQILDKIQGSLIGLALGDALGAHVEFRPRQYLSSNPVTDLEEGGTWGLKKGQFTDDTSMALCLANSLVARQDFVPYDQLVRYKWWYQYGYMSSTGQCFDIGAATSQSIQVFHRRQMSFAKKHHIPLEALDYLSDSRFLEKFKIYCSGPGVAGNGALMRLAPVPLFFYKCPVEAIEFSGDSGQITHGDIKAYDACRYYGALICAALHGFTKEELLDNHFYENHKSWFGEKPLCNAIQRIAAGSYKRSGGYDDGIRGKGYIVNALEAALWAFWSDNGSFDQGVLAAVNLGDDADTTAAIYGQLAGAFYGYKKISQKWTDQIYAKKFILELSKWIAYEGENWKPTKRIYPSHPTSSGMNRSASVDDLVSDTSAAPLAQRRSRIKSETELTGRTPNDNGILIPNTDSTSSSTSPSCSAFNNDTTSPNLSSSQHKPNDTTTSNNFEQSSNKKSNRKP